MLKCLYEDLKVCILYSFSIRCYGNILNCDHIVSQLFVLNVCNLDVRAKATEVFKQIQTRNVKPVLCTWISTKLNLGIHKRKGERPLILFIVRSYYVMRIHCDSFEYRTLL
jgi:hypothetical protein